jgi:hypothetical protein
MITELLAYTYSCTELVAHQLSSDSIKLVSTTSTERGYKIQPVLEGDIYASKTELGLK